MLSNEVSKLMKYKLIHILYLVTEEIMHFNVYFGMKYNFGGNLISTVL